MARVLERWPEAQSDYKWDEWTDGQIRRLDPGVDFKCTIKTMEKKCRKYGADNGFVVKAGVRKTPDGKEFLVVQFTPKTLKRGGRS